MTDDLFSQGPGLEHIPVPGAEISLVREVDFSIPSEEILRRLVAETPWRSEEIVVWGKKHLQPRLVAWYGDPGTTYTYSGLRLEPLPWTPLISLVKSKVEKVAGEAFNSVLLNYYRDERDSISFHSDDEPELGPLPEIAAVSFGETRTMIFKGKGVYARSQFKIELKSGSLLIMKGSTQKNWVHGINKESYACGARVSLTFRKISLL